MTLAKTLALLGHRQAGKTTLAKSSFPDYFYVSLENLDQREFAQSDPKFFLKPLENYPGIIIDEVQHVPNLLPYIQTYIDANQKMGQFILTGSQNYLLNEKITQTLAGRIAISTLLPFSIEELKNSRLLPEDYEELILKGG